MLIADVEELLNINLDNEDVDTIGGWYFTNDIDLKDDYAIEHEGYMFSIYEKDGHQLQFIEVKKIHVYS